MMLNLIHDQMIKIPSGKIELRDDRKKKAWSVEITPFYLSKFLVTQKLYLFVTGENPSFFKSEEYPVESISWLEAIEFCNRLSVMAGLTEYYLIDNPEKIHFNQSANGYRLPTDAEWEYACKANDRSPRYGKLEDIAWYQDNSNNTPQKVGLKEPNNWELYDMLGNVWEWCEDLYDPEVYGTYRVFRGGGWSDKERGVLATNRRRSHPTYKVEDVGFRLARSF